jgi:hypothetical protein
MPQPTLVSEDGSQGWIFFTYDDTPGSINDNRNKRGRHWSQDRKHKQEWEGIYLACFLRERLPRNLIHVKVWFQLQFTDAGRARDPENFRHPVVKPFADCLVAAGYLPDDSADFFVVRELTISKDKLIITPTQRALGRKSAMHVALLYRLAPDALERQRAGGTQLQASRGYDGVASSREVRG